MSTDAYREGQRAAAKDIPAAANPYQDGTKDHEQWAEGHDLVAGAEEANQSEGT
ncbi:MAG: hypothetical protein JWR73_2121 [Tardiphaga sp.]|jgi:hypothetical protein|nr:hypothetical protein [Tardiphaga sp.]MDB5548013.1 hypothetical protein [Tardiphaga sp.]MDB5574486.1 hypothetical protein [Tardiphaga sp.]MDB5626319.1 hypothetical protein [Tardiphaga sp.]MDB5628163.1 hypothetical protein [Tardiphaga sp.]